MMFSELEWEGKREHHRHGGVTRASREGCRLDKSRKLPDSR